MVTTGQTFGADRAMMKQVECSTLQVKPSDRTGCDVVVLFCPVTSRVVPDVERAMKEVSGNTKTCFTLWSFCTNCVSLESFVFHVSVISTYQC